LTPVPFRGLDAVLAVAGWLDLVASVVLVGGLLYAAVVAPPSRRGSASMRTAIFGLVVALAVELGFTALRMAEVSEVRGLRLVVDLLLMRWGTLWVLRAVGVAVLASRGSIATLVAPPWLLLRSLQGHAGAHGVVPAVIDWLHLVAAATWLGGLLQLALAERPVEAAVAQRLRTVATASLAVLLPAGVYGALLHVHTWRMLIDTPYGRTLMAKVGLAAVLVALGAANHFRHVPAIVRGEPVAAARLARTVRAELALALAVLLCSALLGVLPMPHIHPG
jgi:putative copper export protein